MKKIATEIKRFLVRTDGVETVEYGVMTALIIGSVVVALVLMMVVISDTFAQVTELI